MYNFEGKIGRVVGFFMTSLNIQLIQTRHDKIKGICIFLFSFFSLGMISLLYQE